jgi:DNA-binding NarL/FixJ family response regulator
MAGSTAIRVLVADDHLLFAELLAGALSSDDQIEVVGIANNGVEAVRLSHLLHPDVILMDLKMPRLDGVEATRQIISGDSQPPRVLVLTGSDDADALRAAREAGASGFLTKTRTAADLRQALASLVSLAAAFGPEQQASA